MDNAGENAFEIFCLSKDWKEPQKAKEIGVGQPSINTIFSLGPPQPQPAAVDEWVASSRKEQLEFVWSRSHSSALGFLLMNFNCWKWIPLAVLAESRPSAGIERNDVFKLTN